MAVLFESSSSSSTIESLVSGSVFDRFDLRFLFASSDASWTSAFYDEWVNSKGDRRLSMVTRRDPRLAVAFSSAKSSCFAWKYAARSLASRHSLEFGFEEKKNRTVDSHWPRRNTTTNGYFVEMLCIIEKQLNIADKRLERSVLICPEFLLNANKINRLFDEIVVVGMGSMPMQMEERKSYNQIALCNSEANYRLLGSRMKFSQTIRSSSDLYARKAS